MSLGNRFIAPLALLLATPAAAQPIDYSELVGRRIDTTIVTMQTFRFNGEVRTTRITYRGTLQPRPDSQLRNSLTVSFKAADGTTKAKSWSVDTALGKPHPFRDGQAVWIFDNESLIRLRTLDEGGAKSIIKLTRLGDGFACQTEWNHAREVGVGKMTSSATASGNRIQILSETSVSADCRVSNK